MEIWVLLIIAIRSKLPEAVENMEKKIMKYALNPLMPTVKQSEIVCDLINKKNMLVNLKVLSDRIEEYLDEEKLNFLKSFLSDRESVNAYCLKNDRDPVIFTEKIFAYAHEGAVPLEALRLNMEKMEKDYSDLLLVGMTMYTIKRMLASVSASAMPYSARVMLKHCARKATATAV